MVDNGTVMPEQNTDFLSSLSAPARRALENSGIKTLKQLAQKTEKEILRLHGMGKSSLPKLKSVLAGASLSFKK
jgi:DNA-directed RNA polymerase alpha subunit